MDFSRFAPNLRILHWHGMSPYDFNFVKHFHNLIMLCVVKQFGDTDLKILRYLDTVTPLYEESVTEETNIPEVSNVR